MREKTINKRNRKGKNKVKLKAKIQSENENWIIKEIKWREIKIKEHTRIRGNLKTTRKTKKVKDIPKSNITNIMNKAKQDIIHGLIKAKRKLEQFE